VTIPVHDSKEKANIEARSILSYCLWDEAKKSTPYVQIDQTNIVGLDLRSRFHLGDEPPSVAQGGKGVVVSGCPACRKRINTISQFLDHLTNDAIPALIERLATRRVDG
jgi:hypothetical protein